MVTNNMIKLLKILPVFLLGVSCTTIPIVSNKTSKIVVDISEQKLKVICTKTGYKKFETKVETSRVGVGTVLKSKRTPTGNYTVTKEPKHRFGPTLRLSGYQGNTRGILLHRDFVSGNGTSGCICPVTSKYMNTVFRMVDNGTPISIKM
jgi:hypothetical protein